MTRIETHTVAAAAQCVLLLVLGAARAWSQPSGHGAEGGAAADSIRIFKAPEVRIEAESIVPGIARATQPVAVVSRSQIEAANAVDLSDAVAFAPGVFIKQYGGAGGLRTISLRGTSAQQSVVLVDGVRYRAGSNDAFDLSNIPADALERVEVMRGGNATLYGANALGGVVNVVTRPPGQRPLAVAARGSIGSFGERTLGIAGSGSDSANAWDASVHSTVAAGDYPFSFNEFGSTSTVRRENADFSNLFGRAGWSYGNGAGLRLGLDAQAFRSQRGVPGAVVQGSREQLRARLDEGDLFTVARAAYVAGAWTLGATASGRVNGLRYHDPDELAAGPGGSDSHYDEHEFAGGLRARVAIGESGVVEGSTDITYASLRGDNLDPAAGSFVRRTQWGTAVTSNWLIEHGLLGWETSFDGGLRGDLFSDLDPALSPSVGAAWRIASTPVRLRARAASSYRAPSFSEQYYLNYGNRDLRPERSVSIDAGATCELLESFVLEANLFTISTRDQILSIPRSPVSWSAANIAHVLSRGVEFTAAGELFDGRIGLNASYTLMHAEDRSEGATQGKLLPYAPQELFNGVVDVHLGNVGIGGSWQYVSHRYALPSNEYSSSLPRYVVAGANIYAHIPAGAVLLDARLECTNLFNIAYQVVRNYPMPGRGVRLAVGVKFGGEGGTQ